METRRYAEIIWRRKLVILMTLIVTLAVVGAGIHFMTQSYSASAMVRIAGGTNGSLSYSELNYSERLINTYVQAMKGRNFLQGAIQRLGLDMQPDELAKVTRIEALANTELIKITVDSASPSDATRVANTMAALLVEQREKAYTGNAKSPLEVTQQRLADADQQLKTDRATLADLTSQQQATPAPPGAAAQNLNARVQDATTKVRFDEQTYSTLLSDYDKARSDEAAGINSISIVESATEPVVPSKPRPDLYLALGLVAGLMGGIGLAFLFENLDRTIHSFADLEDAEAAPLLGWIPSFSTPNAIGQKSLLPAGAQAGTAGESFSYLSTNLQSVFSGVSSPDNQPSKTLLVASAEAKSGKTTVAVNLAAALARSGRKVMLVDANLRNPSLHKVFGLSNEHGLSDVINNPGLLGAAIQDTRIPRVKLLPGGPVSAGSTDSLGLPGVGQLMTTLAQRADVVLLDSPAMLTVADAAILAPVVDGVLLVAARDQSTRGHLAMALNQLRLVGGNPVGIVFNKARGTGGDRDIPSTQPLGDESASAMLRPSRGSL